LFTGSGTVVTGVSTGGATSVVVTGSTTLV